MARVLMNRKLRNQAQKAIQNVLKQTYFDYIPIGEIDMALQNIGIVMLQEDNTEWSGFFVGNKGECLLRLASIDSADDPKYKAIPTYKPFENAGLCLSWYKCESRKSTPMEVIGYIS